VLIKRPARVRSRWAMAPPASHIVRRTDLASGHLLQLLQGQDEIFEAVVASWTGEASEAGHRGGASHCHDGGRVLPRTNAVYFEFVVRGWPSYLALARKMSTPFTPIRNAVRQRRKFVALALGADRVHPRRACPMQNPAPCRLATN